MESEEASEGSCRCDRMELELERCRQLVMEERRDKTLAASLGLDLLHDNRRLRDKCHELESIQFELQSAIQANRGLREQLKTLDRSFLEEEESFLEETNLREEDLVGQLRALRLQLRTSQRELASVKNEKDTLFAWYEEARDRLDAIWKELDATKQQMARLKHRKERLFRDRVVLQQNNSALREQIVSLKSTQSELCKVRRESRRLTKESLSFQRSLAAACCATPHRFTPCITSTPLPKDASTSFENDLERLQDLIKELRRELESLKREKTEWEALSHLPNSYSLAVELRRANRRLDYLDLETPSTSTLESGVSWHWKQIFTEPLKLLWTCLKKLWSLLRTKKPKSE